MKMKYNIESIRKNDLIILKTIYADISKKYIVNSISTKDDSLAVVPISDDFEGLSAGEKPSFILHVPLSSIAKIEKLPQTDLLFLLDEIDNPHIKTAIESLYDGKRNR